MAALTHDFDLAGLRLSAGEGRRLELDVGIQPLTLGSERYAAEPGRVPVELGISRMTGGGFALRLTFTAAVSGPCMRCLGAAAPSVAVEAREVDVPGGGEEMSSPYVHDETLDLAGWARDAFALAMPSTILCRPECAGLCPVCGTYAGREIVTPGAHGHDHEHDE